MSVHLDLRFLFKGFSILHGRIYPFLLSSQNDRVCFLSPHLHCILLLNFCRFNGLKYSMSLFFFPFKLYEITHVYN